MTISLWGYEIILVWLLQSYLPSHESQATISLIWPSLSVSGHSKQRLGCLANYQETSLSKQMTLGRGKMRNRWCSGSEREAGFLYHRLHFQMLTRTKECFWRKIPFSTRSILPLWTEKEDPGCSLGIVAIGASKPTSYFSSKYSSPDLYSLFNSLWYCHLFTM